MNDAEIGAEIRKYLSWSRLLETEAADKLREYSGIERAAGYRIVSGGQVSGEYWEIRDAETGELLKHGMGMESNEAAWEENWLHEEKLHEWSRGLIDEEDLIVNQASKLPESLMEALYEWADQYPDEVQELLAD